MSSDKQTFLAWLRDAHAMEKATVDNLERLIDRLEDYPELRGRFQQHLDDSRLQAERVEGCLGRLGADPSTIKDTAMRAIGVAQSFAAGATPDEPVKNCLAAYAYKNFEIASYTSLGAAAEALGEPEVRQVCEQNLREEREMANWLEQRIPDLTRQFLQRAA